MSEEDSEIRVRGKAQKEEEERKGGAPPIPLFASGARPGLPAGLGWARAMLTSESGLFGLAVALVSAATLASSFAPLVQDAVFGKPVRAASALHSGAGRPVDAIGSDAGPGDSLGYLRNANRGAMGGPAASPGTSGSADAAKGEKASPPDKAPDPGAWASAIAGAAGGKDGKAESDGRPRLADSGFGKLSSGLAGGAGLGGGAAAGARAPVPSGARGASGADAGRLASAAGASRRLSSAGRGSGRGGVLSALGQLKRASAVSRAGVGMNPEASRATEAQAFDGGAGKPAEGKGIGSGGVGAGTPETPPSQSASRDQRETPAPDPGEGKDETPWKDSLTIAKLLLLAADAMLVMAALMSKGQVLKFGLGGSVASLLAQGAILLSLVVVAIGYGIMQQHGQNAQGQILMLAGGVAAGGAALALAIGKAQPLLLLMSAAASGLIGTIGTSMGKKTFGF